jgi:hypothetical protein
VENPKAHYQSIHADLEVAANSLVEKINALWEKAYKC